MLNIGLFGGHFLLSFNELNLQLQGRQCIKIDAADKVISYCKKLDLWMSYIKRNSISMFPTLNDFCSQELCTVEAQILLRIQDHLKNMRDHFEYYIVSTR